jgi:two-component system LytT family sensor kinase
MDEEPKSNAASITESGGPSAHSRPRWVTLTLLLLVFTTLGFFRFNYRYLDDLARNRHGTLVRCLLEELTGVYSALLLLPLVIYFGRRFSWQRTRWLRFLAAHLTGALLFSLLHTSLMAVSRRLVAPLLGLGNYDYGIMGYRYPMELSNDLIVYFMFLGFFYFFQSIRQARERELATAQLQARLAETRLENLRLQLQPHFLFNTLNMISSIMYEDVKAADAMIARLSDLLRFSLGKGNQQEILFAEELEITRMYVDIMQARFEQKLRVQYDVEPDVQEALIPQLTLQPLVENAVRHNMDADAGIEIELSAKRDNGSLAIKISDNGAGIDESEVRTPRGIGLANTQARLAQLYGARQEFCITRRKGGGTEVLLKVPFETCQERPG